MEETKYLISEETKGKKKTTVYASKNPDGGITVQTVVEADDSEPNTSEKYFPNARLTRCKENGKTIFILVGGS